METLLSHAHGERDLAECTVQKPCDSAQYDMRPTSRWSVLVCHDAPGVSGVMSGGVCSHPGLTLPGCRVSAQPHAVRRVLRLSGAQGRRSQCWHVGRQTLVSVARVLWSSQVMPSEPGAFPRGGAQPIKPNVAHIPDLTEPPNAPGAACRHDEGERDA